MENKTKIENNKTNKNKSKRNLALNISIACLAGLGCVGTIVFGSLWCSIRNNVEAEPTLATQFTSTYQFKEDGTGMSTTYDPSLVEGITLPTYTDKTDEEITSIYANAIKEKPEILANDSFYDIYNCILEDGIIEGQPGFNYCPMGASFFDTNWTYVLVNPFLTGDETIDNQYIVTLENAELNLGMDVNSVEIKDDLFLLSCKTTLFTTYTAKREEKETHEIVQMPVEIKHVTEFYKLPFIMSSTGDTSASTKTWWLWLPMIDDDIPDYYFENHEWFARSYHRYTFGKTTKTNKPYIKKTICDWNSFYGGSVPYYILSEMLMSGTMTYNYYLQDVTPKQD